MYPVLKRLLFCFNPESAHHIAMTGLNFIYQLPGGAWLLQSLFAPSSHENKPVEVLGLRFQNSIGLAAGFDKNAKYIECLSALGFSHIEIGTVTPKPQVGNDKPRLFRLPKDEALINRMGFNNDGVDAVVLRLKNLKNREKYIIGGNIGKNKVTPNDQAVNDYITCFNALHAYVDYFTINVSSPNTPGLRDLQDKEPLTALLQELVVQNTKYQKPKPILLKIAPDLTASQLDDVIEIAQSVAIDGIIATNTTIDRSTLSTNKTEVDAIGLGGLSGKPLKKSADDVLQYLSQRITKKPFCFVGVGGVDCAQDVQDKIKKGADLVQVYSGFIYRGPSLVSLLLKEV